MRNDHARPQHPEQGVGGVMIRRPHNEKAVQPELQVVVPPSKPRRIQEQHQRPWRPAAAGSGHERRAASGVAGAGR